MAFARRARVRVRAESVCARAQSVHATGKLHAQDAALPWGCATITNDLNVEGGLFAEPANRRAEI